MDERRTSPIELFWDLVFVFAVTQVSTLLAHDLTWPGFGRAMLVLALVWWAWSAFVWVTNAHDPRTPSVRAVLFAAMVLAFVVALAVPGAFRGDATTFAIAYTGVRVLHLALYADAARRGNASFAAIAGFATTVGIGMALLIVGAQLHDTARTALWVAAAAIDYAGPAWLTRERLVALQRVAVAHFAERYSLFIIICLGESVVAIGVGATGRALDLELLVGVGLALAVTVGLWWSYFNRVAEAAEERLRVHEQPVLAAADAYSYLHLLLVAGIIVFAVGAKTALHDVGEPLEAGGRLALCGGVALYLAGHLAFIARMLATVRLELAAAALACLAVFALTADAPAWVPAGAVALILLALATIPPWTSSRSAPTAPTASSRSR